MTSLRETRELKTFPSPELILPHFRRKISPMGENLRTPLRSKILFFASLFSRITGRKEKPGGSVSSGL